MTTDDVRDCSLTRPDGRTVAWTDVGPADGVPLLRIPGTPGCRWSIRADRTAWQERRLRAITTERPGFGASSRLPGRGFAEHADDLAAVLDEVGFQQVHVIGGSGASPHILAFLAYHPERVRAATVVVGTAPVEDEEIDAMIDLNATAYRLARAGDVDGLRALLEPLREQTLADPLASFRAIMAQAPPDDQAVMNDPVWQQGFLRAQTEALAQGVDGWLDEALAIDGDWADIPLDRVRASVTWWHSDGDRNCPIDASRRLVDKLPDATFRVWSDAGHLTPYRHEPELLDELLARG